MTDLEECTFHNLPNFRQAGGRGLVTSSGRRVRDGLLYRSSRTDFLSEEETTAFNCLGIKAIIDLRRKSEYERSDGEKLLDTAYPPCVIEKGKLSELKPSMRWGSQLRKRQQQQQKSQGSSEPSETPPCFKGKRYLVNMLTMDLIWAIFTKVNFFVRYLSLMLVAVDWLFGCHYFVKFFYWAVINRQTMASQYVEILEFTKRAVVDILRVVTEENVPVLIHCAHGKDRTGLIVALILSCIGVDDDTIAEDYAKSEVSISTFSKHEVMLASSPGTMLMIGSPLWEVPR